MRILNRWLAVQLWIRRRRRRTTCDRHGRAVTVVMATIKSAFTFQPTETSHCRPLPSPHLFSILSSSSSHSYLSSSLNFHFTSTLLLFYINNWILFFSYFIFSFFHVAADSQLLWNTGDRLEIVCELLRRGFRKFLQRLFINDVSFFIEGCISDDSTITKESCSHRDINKWIIMSFFTPLQDISY